ncbi:hypothetical protein E3983_08230 [Legionella israelensis]|uniref:Uncharacterized protein n=1 Tax=Legionella israelensis TaxID=454 RepID=A0AAX1EGY2_9GAMM|nr:hypothetical protein [Legionella israelensis]QBR84348.1 hypothetical protein E3983_08230 [Legionella israelensis]
MPNNDYDEFLVEREKTLKNRIEGEFNTHLSNVLNRVSPSFFSKCITFFNLEPTHLFLRGIHTNGDLNAFEKFGAVAEHYSGLKHARSVNPFESSWLDRIACSVFQPLGNGIPANVYSDVEAQAKNAYHRKIEPLADTMEVNL